MTRFTFVSLGMYNASNSLDDPPVTILRLVTIQVLVLLLIFNQSEALPRSYQSEMVSMEFLCSFLRRQIVGKPLFFYSTKMLMITKPDACPFEKEKLLAALLFSSITM